MSAIGDLVNILNNNETKILDNKKEPVQHILDTVRMAKQEYIDDKMTGNFPAILKAEVDVIQEAERLAVNLSCRKLEPGVHIEASTPNKYEALRERIKE